MKTSELTGPALDWAVAQCNGVECDEDNEPIWFEHDGPYAPRCPYQPSKDWEHGGPIIERERISLTYSQMNEDWQAAYHEGPQSYIQVGPTPLIAAMRCYVASALGDEIDTPDGL